MGEPAVKNSGQWRPGQSGNPAGTPKTQFKPGESGNPAGKPIGALNHRTREIRTVAYRLVNDAKYRKRLKERLLDGTAGQMEILLWHYAFGKPKETIEYHGDPLIAFQQLVVEVLGQRNGHAIEIEADGNGNGNGDGSDPA